MERALAGLLNAASAGEEARGSLFTRIQECAFPLSTSPLLWPLARSFPLQA